MPALCCIAVSKELHVYALVMQRTHTHVSGRRGPDGEEAARGGAMLRYGAHLREGRRRRPGLRRLPPREVRAQRCVAVAIGVRYCPCVLMCPRTSISQSLVVTLQARGCAGIRDVCVPHCQFIPYTCLQGARQAATAARAATFGPSPSTTRTRWRRSGGGCTGGRTRARQVAGPSATGPTGTTWRCPSRRGPSSATGTPRTAPRPSPSCCTPVRRPSWRSISAQIGDAP